MKRSGLWLATVATALVAVFAVKAVGWFDASASRRPVSRVSVHDAERWYRSGQDRHWRCLVLQTR